MKKRKGFLPYGRQSISKKDIYEVEKVLKSEWITTGPEVGRFEEAFKEYIGCKYAVAVNSGTAALDIAVNALNLKGGEVITTPFTFVASSNCLLYNNLKPVFADIEKETFNISPEKIKKKITKKTKAILCVDFAGHPCDLDMLKEIAEKHNLFLIEDAAHALGAEYHGKKIGTLADLTTFSFHPVKHITTGEGGMIATDNKNFYERAMLLRNHGIDKSTMQRFGRKSSWEYDVKLLGRNYRITDFQCALGTSQLKGIEKNLAARERLAAAYNKALGSTEGITLPFSGKNIRHAWHLYPVLLDKRINRNAFFKKMREFNIGVNVLYKPIYRFSLYKNFRISKKEFPVTEDVFSRIIVLPLFPTMKIEDISDVSECVRKCITNAG